ncbi:MAG TPA: hypothetical protein VFG59_13115, partial [Anaeromyxobacter sp.]|nr:hypothetical protein [Anaeromyxobacter sp.]
GFLVGMLAVLGVPPTLGFSGRWRLFEAAGQLSPGLLAAFAVASGLALVAYVLAFTRAWWGPAPESGAPPAREPALLRATVVVLCALLVLAGAWPGALALLTGGGP